MFIKSNNKIKRKKNNEKGEETKKQIEYGQHLGHN